MKLYAVLLHAWAYAYVARVNAQVPLVFQPTSTYDSTIVNSANQTVTARTISFTCSNAMVGGRLEIGNYYVDVECIPPRYQYYYDEVGQVPRGVQLMIDEVCLTDDTDAFFANNPNPSLAALQRLASSAGVTGGGSAARKLLADKDAGSGGAGVVLGVVGIVVGAIALGTAAAALTYALEAKSIATDARSTADQALGKVQGLQDEINLVNSSLVAIQSYQGQQDIINTNNTQNFKNIATQFDDQAKINAQMAASAIATNATIDILRQHVQDDFVLLNDNIINATNILQTQMAATDAQVRAQLTSIWDAIDTSSTTQHDDSNNIYDLLEDANENIAGVNSIVWDLMRQRQLRNLLNSGFFAHADLLPVGASPLLKDAGLPPNPSGDFAPQDQSVLLERVDVNFAQPLQSTTHVTNQQIKFYFNTSFALDNAKPFLTVRSLLKLIGPPGCVRAGPGGDGLPATENCYPNGFNSPSICCTAWVELDTYTCTAPGNNFLFSNQTNSTAQNTVLTQGAPCVDVPGAPTKQLITDAATFFGVVNSAICTPAASSEYMIRTIQSGQIAYAPAAPSSACQLTYQDQISYGPPTTAWKWLLTFFSYAYNSFQPILSNYNQALYGRLPGGLSYETVPFVYMPPQYDNVTGLAINTGAAEPSVCHYAYWVAATDAVTPVYAMTPVAGNNIQKLILVNMTQIQFQAPQPGDTIVPSSLQVYDGSGGQVVLSNDASNLLPGNVLLVGNINDDVLYDVPDTLMDVSKSASARANKATYYLMDPNTTTTWNLNQWIAAYGDVYQPLDAAVNPASYAYLSVQAADGYPICGVSGGQPTETQLLGINTAPQCIAGFTRQDDSWQAAAQNTTGGLNQCSFGNVVYLDGAAASLSGFSEAWKTGAYVYSYWFRSSTNAPSASGFFNTFTATYTGSIPVKMGVTTGTTASNVFGYASFAFNTVTAQGKQNLVDGLWHQVAWVFDNTAKTATLYVDGYFSQQFPWDISAITFSGTPSFTAPSATGVAVFSKSTSTTSLEVQRLALCQQNLVHSHCSNTNGGEQYIIARQASPVITTMSCTHSTILYTTDLYESYKPSTQLASTFMTDAQWSVSVWVYSTFVTQGTTSQLFSIKGPKYGMGITLTNPDGQGTRIGVVIYSNSAPLTIDTGVSFSGTTQWHNLIISAAAGTLTVFADSQPTASVSYTFNNAVNIAAGWSFTATGNYAYLQYYTTAFDTLSAYTEYHCQMTSQLDNYSPPVGFCRVSGTNPQGYCRYMNSCNGQCEILATVSQSALTWVAGANTCDNGMNAPSCLTACSHYDSASGQCLGNFNQTSAVGVIPNSQWCLFLRNYQVSTGFVDPDTQRQTLFATPRSWSYMATVAVPQGQIVSEVATAVCPSVQLSGNSGQGASVILTNSAGVTAPVRVTQGQQTPDNSTGTDLSCYNVDTHGFFSPKQQTAVLPPFASYAMQISVCPNMTLQIDIQQLVGNTLTWESCTSLTADFVDAGVQLPASLPNDVQTVITTAVSEIQLNQAQLGATLYSNTLQLMYYMAQSFNASSALQEFIANQSAGVAAITFNPTNFTALFNTDFNLNTPDYQAALAGIAGNMGAVTQWNNDIIGLNDKNRVLQQNMDDAIARQANDTADLAKALKGLQDLITKNNDASASSQSIGGSNLSITDILLIIFGSIIGLILAYYGYKYYKKYYSGAATSGGVKYMKLGGAGDDSVERTDAIKKELTARFMRHRFNK